VQRSAADPIVRYTEEELRKQLLNVPEVTLDAIRGTSERVVEDSLKAANEGTHAGPTDLLADRVDLRGLPFLNGADCQLGKESAENLQALARGLRAHIREARSKESSDDVRIDPDFLRSRIHSSESPNWRSPDAIPALLQMLQAERAPVRKLMVDMLAEIDDPRATAALAMRAMVDLSPDVRRAATKALCSRSVTDFRAHLLAGLRHPWPPVAAHAAQALMGVRDRGAVPTLIALLDRPAPGLPAPASDRDSTLNVRELVRVNHLHNCLLCHPPSFDKSDLVRAAVPSPDQPIDGGTAYYDPSPLVVHADVTYLRQDFSVTQPVEIRPAKWPAFQRFDYMVRTRVASAMDVQRLEEARGRLTREYRANVLMALRGLTGIDAGAEAGDWRTALVAANFPLADGDTPVGAVREWRQFLPQEPTLAAGPGPRPWTSLPQQQGEMASQLARLPVARLRERLFDAAAEVRAAAARASALKRDSALTLELIFLLGDKDALVAQQARAALYALTGRDDGPDPSSSRVEQRESVAEWLAWWRTQATRSGSEATSLAKNR
jgi:HEAT repeat protein